MALTGKLRGVFLYYPKEVRVVKHDVYASHTTPLWLMVASENVEYS